VPHQNACKVEITLDREEATDLDAVFRQLRVQAGEKDNNRSPTTQERETLARDLLVTAVAATLLP
jgi:hypothetical protein